MVRTGERAISGQVSLSPWFAALVSPVTVFIKPVVSRLPLSLFSYPPRLYHRIHSHYYHPLSSTHSCTLASPHPRHRSQPNTILLAKYLPTQHHGRREQPEPKRASQEVSEPIGKYTFLLSSSDFSISRASTDFNNTKRHALTEFV